MQTIILAELGVSVVAWLVFLAMSRGMWSSPTGRQMTLAALVALAEAASLLALGLGLRVPAALFVVGFGLADVVVLRWVWLRWRARRQGPAQTP